MQDNPSPIEAMLRDLIKLNAVIATELIQLVENSSRRLHGDIPESCRVQHGTLRREIVEIAEKWHDGCRMLRRHNLDHE